MNRWLFLFLCYSSFVWCADFLYTFLCVPIWGSIGTLCMLGVLLYVVCRKHVSFAADHFSKWDAAAIASLVFVYLIHVHTPDTDWDVISYHILHQQPLPWSQVSESFFPSTMLHSFLFPLADRMSLAFRHVLGFRLGTLLSLLVGILIYIQLRQIILKQGRVLSLCAWQVSLLACAIATAINVLPQIHTYYADLRTVPILLYFLDEFLNGAERKSAKTLLLMAWCIGIEICFKLSAGIPLLAAMAYFLWMSRACLSVRVLAAGFGLAVLPLIPYAYTNVLETQSPFFPFLYQIWPSKLLLHGKDSSMIYGDILFSGPQTLVQALVWPFREIVQAKPFGMDRKEALLVAFGLVSSVGLWRYRGAAMVGSSKKLAIAYGCFYLFGALVYHSFMRYNVGLDVISGLACGFLGIVLCRKRSFYRGCGLLFFLVLALQPFGFFRAQLWGAKDATHPPLYRDRTAGIADAKKIFRDRDAGAGSIQFDKVKAWLVMCSQPTSGYAYLLKDTVPIIDLDGYTPLYIDIDGTYENPTARTIYEQHMHKWLGNGMYVLLQTQENRPTYLPDGIKQATLMGELIQMYLRRGVQLRHYEQIEPSFIRANHNITMAEAVPADAETVFQDYLVEKDASCTLKKTFAGTSIYRVTLALEPDKQGSIPKMAFRGHIHVYDPSHQIAEQRTFQSRGEYVSMDIPVDGELEIVFDGAEHDAKKLMVLSYEESYHGE